MKPTVFFVFICITLRLSAQVDTGHINLDAVKVVDALSADVSDYRVPVSGSFEEVSLRGVGNPLLINTTENLNLIPALAAFNGTAGTAKLSFRGIGARSQYTTSRTLVYLDQIPITSIQGFSSFEDLNPTWFHQLHFTSGGGQTTPLALGGVLQYTTLPKSIERNSFSLQQDVNIGSFGYVQSQSVVHIKQENFDVKVGYENTQKKGWRDNNELSRESVLLKPVWKLGTHNTISLLGLAIKSRVEIPSSLSLEDFTENPEKAASTWSAINGFKEYERLITGLNWKHTKGSGENEEIFTSSIFYKYYKNYEARPFNILEEDQNGGGVRFTYQKPLFFTQKSRHEIHVFSEYQLGNEEANTFQNEYDSVSAMPNVQGAALNSTQILGQRINAGLVATSHFYSSKNKQTSLALNYGVNLFYQYNQLINKSLGYEIPLEWAPVFKVLYSSKNGFSPFIKVYRSVSIPAIEENLDPDGSLNQNLKPELAGTVEVGVAKRFSGEKAETHVQMNTYYTQVENLIVPKALGEDQIVAINSGISEHMGIELEAGQIFSLGKQHQLKYSLSGYVGRYRYLVFSDTSTSFKGNYLPGYPDHQINTSIEWGYSFSAAKAWTKNMQFRAGLWGRETAPYFVDDENTVKTNSYFLLQTWVKLQKQLGNHIDIALQTGLKNVTNTAYASMTVVNNQGFGGAPRYYYPGEPFNWFGGVSVKYKW